MKFSKEEAEELIEGMVEAAKELCPNYPNIEKAHPYECLYALKETCRGIDMANKDLHSVMKQLCVNHNLTKVDIIKASEMVEKDTENKE